MSFKKTNFITAKEFCEKYGIKENHLYITKSCKKNIPTLAFKSRKPLLVDEMFFLRRKEFAKKVELQSHELYYLLEPYFSDSAMAKAVVNVSKNTVTAGSMRCFFSCSLFSNTSDKSILNYKIDSRLWHFYRWARWVVLDVAKLANFRRIQVATATSKILDNRMVA